MNVRPHAHTSSGASVSAKSFMEPSAIEIDGPMKKDWQHNAASNIFTSFNINPCQAIQLFLIVSGFMIILLSSLFQLRERGRLWIWL